MGGTSSVITEPEPVKAPSLAALSKPAIQAEIVKAVREQFRPAQLELGGVTEQPDFASVVAKTTELVQQQTITIPRIQVVPTGVVTVTDPRKFHFIAGRTPADPETYEVVHKGDFAGQYRWVMKQLDLELREAA